MLTLTAPKYAGRRATSIDELRALPSAVTYEGAENYEPVNHADLAQRVLDRLDAAGFSVASETYALVHGDAAVVATLALDATPGELPPAMLANALAIRSRSPFLDADAKGLITPDDIRLEVSWRHGNDGEWAFRLNGDARVTVCTNGMTAALSTGSLEEAEIVRQMHLAGANYDDVIDRSIANLGAHFDAITHLRGSLAAAECSDEEGDALIVRAGMDELVPWTTAKVVAREWHTPSHDDFAPRNRWSLYNAFTEALKTRAVDGQIQSFAKLGRFLAPQAYAILN